MERKDVIVKLCVLASEVGSFLGNRFAHDCFCKDHEEENVGTFSFEPEVFDFIREAVQEKMHKAAFEKENQQKERSSTIIPAVQAMRQVKLEEGDLRGKVCECCNTDLGLRLGLRGAKALADELFQKGLLR